MPSMVAAISRRCSSSIPGSWVWTSATSCTVSCLSQNGHAVVRFLPGKKAAVAGRGQRRHRKILIDELGFLQADDVDRLALQPLQQVPRRTFMN